jgi:hypothetical protein
VTNRTSEPASRRHVSPPTPPRIGLFSHPPQTEVLDQHRPRISDGVDWRATPFSDAVADQRHAGRPRLTHRRATP